MKKIGLLFISLSVILILKKRSDRLKQKINIWQDVEDFLKFMNKMMNYYVFSVWTILLQYAEENTRTVFYLDQEEPMPPHKAIERSMTERNIESEEKEQIVKMIRELEERTEADVVLKIKEEIVKASENKKKYIEKLLTEKKTIRPIILSWAALAIIFLL